MEVCSKKQKLYVLGIVLFLIVTGSLLSKRSKPSGENTLQPLLVREMYASGSMLERSKTFAARFESYMETAAIPNIREDSTGQDTAIITDSKSDLILLQEFPEQDIYIWGYNDVEEPGYGLIFDVGDTPHIDSFPYFYESNHGIPPDFILSADGKTIFCICHTGFGTGFSVSELILFQLEDFQIEPYYLNIDELSDRLNDTIQVVYDADMDAVTVSAGGSDPKSYRLSAVGAEPGERIIPTGYFCGNFLSFSLQGEQLFVHFKPTLYTDASNAAIYLDDFQEVTAQIVFQYDDSGKIDGYEICETNILEKK